MEKRIDTRPTLCIDVDDTLVGNFMLPLLNLYMGKTHRRADLKYANVQENFAAGAERDKFLDFCFSKTFYDGIELLAGADEVMRKLNKKYQLYLCTDTLVPEREWQSDKVFADRWQMLKRHFPYLSPTQFIFMRAKTLLRVDVFIDDRIANLAGATTKLLFTSPPNADIPDTELRALGVKRVNSWSEVGECLL
jgi:5'(3')-deoxyribonucleotidase